MASNSLVPTIRSTQTRLLGWLVCIVCYGPVVAHLPDLDAVLAERNHLAHRCQLRSADDRRCGGDAGLAGAVRLGDRQLRVALLQPQQSRADQRRTLSLDEASGLFRPCGQCLDPHLHLPARSACGAGAGPVAGTGRAHRHLLAARAHRRAAPARGSRLRRLCGLDRAPRPCGAAQAAGCVSARRRDPPPRRRAPASPCR